MDMMKKEMPLRVHTRELAKLMIGEVASMHKGYKFTFAEHINDACIELMIQVKYALRATEISGPDGRLDRINQSVALVDRIDVMAELMFEVPLINDKKFMRMSRLLENISRQLAGWKKSSEEKLGGA